jgi:predicted ATPase
LPVQLTSFVGRQDELAEVCTLLRTNRVRLLTLTGAGGCGKTRLALRVGEELAQAYAHGVWLVELAPFADAELVVKTVAATFDLREGDSGALLAALAEHVRPRQMLLILDNCEHLVEAAAHVAAALLQACHQLQILATSTQALAVPGEVNYCVQPLALPPTLRKVQPTRAGVAAFDAIQLFVERARTVRRTFELTDHNAGAVARICQRLDGIPLGIELAAAWVNLLAPEQIAQRLEQDFDLLVSSSRPVLPRHQTLRATIEWSCALLSEVEQRLLRRLSVFVGGWNLAAAEAVTTGGTDALPDRRACMEARLDAPLEMKQVLSLLGQLVNKSLVSVDRPTGGEARYRLLEPVRVYLQEQIAAAEDEALHDRHLAHFIGLAETANSDRKHSQSLWRAKMEADQENFRAALAWGQARQPEAGLRLAVALARYWSHRGYYAEGRRWLQAALAQVAKPSQMRAEALLWAGRLARMQGDVEAARPLCLESLLLFRDQKDLAGAATALENIGWTCADNDRSHAIACFEESLALFREQGCRRQAGRLLTTLAQMARERADCAQATQQLQEALALLRAADDGPGRAHALNGLAELASLAGDYEQAARLLHEALDLITLSGSEHELAWVHCALTENCWHRRDYAAALQHGEISRCLFQELGGRRGPAIIQHHLGLAWLASGSLDQAEQCLRSSLAACCPVQMEFMAARCLAGLAAVALQRGQATWAATALGAATACLAAHPHPLTPADEAFCGQLCEDCRAQLDSSLFATAWSAGQAIPMAAWSEFVWDLERAAGNGLRR